MSRRFLLSIALTVPLSAQTAPPQSVPPTSRPVQVPLSGRTGQPGGVVTVQNPLPAGLESVNTITSTVQVQGAYQGSVAGAATAGPPLVLSLDEAVRRGLQSNLGAIVNQQNVRFAEAMRTVERSNLLPYVSSNLLVNEQQTNLAALGFSGLPGVPQIVGPFHYFDLRAGASQSVFDLTRIRNYRGSQENVRSAQLSAQDARDLIVLAVTGAYLQIVSATARVETTRAQVTTARATNQQAIDRHAAGVAPRIDVTRTQVELQVEQQRLFSVENDLAKLKIGLGRLIGLPPGQQFTLSDVLPYSPLTGVTVDQALTGAYANRSDLKAAESQVRV